MELRLIHSLVDRDVYDGCVHLIKPTIFSEDTQDIVEAIQVLHSELDEGVDLDVVHEHLRNKKVSTTAKMSLLDELMEKVRDTDPVATPVAIKFIRNLAVKAQRLEALNQLAVIIEKNEESHEQVISTLEELSMEQEEDTEVISLELSDLAQQYSSSGGYPFFLQALQHNVGSMADGNLLIVFGRPEAGKSSFTAGLVSGFLKSGNTVDYYANEEPGRKIALNIRRAFTGEDDKAIASAYKSKKDDPAWVAASKFLKVREVGDMDIETVQARTKKEMPNVLVLDQIDKIHMQGKFGNTADRLKALYERARSIAKSGCLVIVVSQASADGDDKRVLTLSMMENSKTGKAGEADIVIGVGKKGEDEEDMLAERNLHISKNKINGWHGNIPALFNPRTNQWTARGDD